MKNIIIGLFVVSLTVGLDFALSYTDLAQENNWKAWKPGIGIFILCGVQVFFFIALMRNKKINQESPNESGHRTAK